MWFQNIFKVQLLLCTITKQVLCSVRTHTCCRICYWLLLSLLQSRYISCLNKLSKSLFMASLWSCKTVVMGSSWQAVMRPLHTNYMVLHHCSELCPHHNNRCGCFILIYHNERIQSTDTGQSSGSSLLAFISVAHNNRCSCIILTLTVLVMTIDAQWEGMGDVGLARYEPALLSPCLTIRVLSYSS